MITFPEAGCYCLTSDSSFFSISASPKLTFGLKKTLISVNEVPRILKSAEILKSEICCSCRRSLNASGQAEFSVKLISGTQ